MGPQTRAKGPFQGGAQVTKGKGFVLELFAGSARLSRALRRRGLNAYGVDHKGNRHKPQAPMIVVDLTTTSGHEVIWRSIKGGKVVAVHLAPHAGGEAWQWKFPSQFGREVILRGP